MKRGRPSNYSPEIADEICRLIAEGNTCRQIEAMNGMPSWRTVCSWFVAHHDFQQQYARAREISAEMLEAEGIAAARTATNENAQAARVYLDAMKWAASKRNPKVYGDKQQISGDPDSPLTITVRRLVSGA